MMALEADRLSFSYGEVPVLSCASFGLPQGGFAALIGPNGAGKSTLLKLLLGELSPSSGAVRLLGQDTARFRNWRRLGYVPQDGLARHTDFPASVEEVVLANLSGGDRPAPLPEAGAPGAGAAGPGIGGNGRLWAPADWSPVRRAAPAGVAGQGSDLPPGGHAAGRAHLRHGTCKAGRTFTACWPG